MLSRIDRTWPDRPSRRPGCTATCGRATCCGRPTGGPGWSTRPRTAGTGRPTWPSSPCSAARPHLDRILAAYEEVWPLADGWRERVPLHQLHLLLVHAALFGAAYRACGAGGGPRARAVTLTGVLPASIGLVSRNGSGLDGRTCRPGRPVRPDGDRPAGVADRPVQPALHVLHARGGPGLAAQADAAHRRRDRAAGRHRRAAPRRHRGPVHRRRAAAAPGPGRTSSARPRRCAAAAALGHHQRRSGWPGSPARWPRPGWTGSTSRWTRCGRTGSTR